MAVRIEIGLKRGVRDARGHNVVRRVRSYFHLPVRSCETRDVYKVEVRASPTELQAIRKALTDPVIARSAIGRLRPPRFDWLIEVFFRPGVTDNVGRTARSVIEDLLDRPLGADEDVYTGTQYFLRAPEITKPQVEQIGTGLLANPLIQTLHVYSAAEWAVTPPDTAVPAIREQIPIEVRAVSLDVPDEELMRISRERILSLSLEEMRAIREHYKDPAVRAVRSKVGLPHDPTDAELECIAQTWSEHCKHKIFSAVIRYVDETGKEEIIHSLFNTYIRGATERIRERVDWLVSVFSDNAGIIRFNDRYNIACKCETHNTPSALDPYGGAITGIVGVNRDPMGTGMGCEMLCNIWGYCFASPFYTGEVPEGLMSPRRIRDGVHQGVSDGGNQSGIPWARGFERFDERYLGKPLVYCGTVGRIPRFLQGRPSERKEVKPGDVIVMVGGRIGKDGIHGATFSSEELRKESPAQAVQIGDPITQRKMYEFLMEARDAGLYRALTDNGAGGLSSSVGELCRLSGGADLDLALAPLKYPGLMPWEILLSEAQERMTVAVPPDQLDPFLALARRRDVEATALGRFTDSGAFLVRYDERVVAYLPLDFLHDGCPRMELPARWTPPNVLTPKYPRSAQRGRHLKALLASLNICSKQFKSFTYDGEVKGLSVIKPFVGVHADVPSDATVMRVEHGSDEGLAIAEAINPYYSDLDTYHMMASIIDEAVRRILSVGGRWGRIAALDNFCWPDPVLSERTPDGPYKLAQLVRANKALYDYTVAYGVPCISGKDSMKNDSIRGGRKISIPPTVLFTTLGYLSDVRRAVTMYFKRPGDLIYVLGWTRDELGASEYHRWLATEQGTPERFGGQVPTVDPDFAVRLYQAMDKAHSRGLFRSCHTPSLGGLGVAFALAAIGGNVGAEIDLRAVPTPSALSIDALLFAESNSRFVVTCDPARASELEDIFHDLPHAQVGVVSDALVLNMAPWISEPIEKLRAAFKRTLWGL